MKYLPSMTGLAIISLLVIYDETLAEYDWVGTHFIVSNL